MIGAQGELLFTCLITELVFTVYCLAQWKAVAVLLLSSSLLGSGGYAYLREWLWWAGLLTSKFFFFILVDGQM